MDTNGAKQKPVNVLGWPNTQAVLLTVPPFPMHVADIRAFVSERRQMSDKAFRWALLELLRTGFVRQAKSLTGAVMKLHFYCDQNRLRYDWKKPEKYAWHRSIKNRGQRVGKRN